MDARSQLRRLMSDVDHAASRAERSLARARTNTPALAAAPGDDEAARGGALRLSFGVAAALMTMKLAAEFALR